MSGRKALFLASPVPEAAGAMRGWIDGGNEIAEVWYGRHPRPGLMHRDGRLAILAPRWSTTAVVRRHGIVTRDVLPLSGWAERLQAVEASGADVLISTFFPFRVPQDVLDRFGTQAVNLHPAPLPAYRGPHVTQALVLDGQIVENACVTLHRMDAGFDSGDVIETRPIAYPEDGNFARYTASAGRAAWHLTAEALPRYLAGELEAQPQNEGEARYRRMDLGKIAIGRHLDVQTARVLCETMGSLVPLPLGEAQDIKITGIVKQLGLPSGHGPDIGRFTVDADVADGRLRLRRAWPWSSTFLKFKRLATLIAERDAT
ncbi:MAG: hypothetical protein KKB66_13360 [Alphaproteobacteria bacterium]|nr:hypothetical protein [Alphaproteobacteria bacterium]MBU0805395.1 hypothetical protein [Alphaproteobacteria bacterium]MBU0873341.1 hypothetical protein [Alphaproteobacteria bacterium]MBU1401431.1 hypothetical protein [Alphaproteobacteria bacterium]MBU1592152.1 hypothetical protein [Alphaproteobacteria bacterium]